MAQAHRGRFRISYGTGEVGGFLDYDDMELGDPAIKIPNQGFGEAILVSDEFENTSCDGTFVSGPAQGSPDSNALL